MRNGFGQAGAGTRATLRSLLAAGITAIAMLAPADDDAWAAPCPAGSTSWQGGSGGFNEDANWTNGGPSGSCDAFITAPGTYTVTMTAGANMKSLTLGGAGSSPTLVISAAGPNTNLNATTTGIDIKAGAAVVLTCPPLPGGCNGGPTTGGSSLNSGSAPFTNQGTITVDAASGTGATIVGPLVNTGTVQIEQDTHMNNGAVVNQGALSIAGGKTLTSSGSHCGDTSVSFKNDTGGSIVASGTGTLNVVNYEQGNGTTSGAVPVNVFCGSLKYTGNGASEVQATGGFALTGEIHSNQSLTVLSQSNNTNVTLGADLVNKGSVTLSCFPTVPPALSGCNGADPGSGVGFNVNGHQFTNAGTLTVAAPSGTGVNIDGNGGMVTNTGTMQFDQSARLSGHAVNKGVLNISDGKTVRASSSSCGSGEPVKNDAGGSINATGTGTFEVLTAYEQGDGTTSGPSPVTMNCGTLEYVGAGASTVQVTATSTMTGAPAGGQTLRISGTVNAPSTFTNAGTIALAGGTLNFGDTATNTGRLGGVGTITGSVDNSTGVVAPGASPGTLAVNGGYAQGAGGGLEIEIAGTGVGQFDKLTIGGGATLNGTLALQPTSGYAGSAALGDGIDFLTYGSTRSGQFAQVTTIPSLVCPKQFALDYADVEKRVGVDVLDGPSSCGGGGGGSTGGSTVTTPPAISLPAPVAKKAIKCKKGFRKVKAKGKTQCKRVKKKKRAKR